MFEKFRRSNRTQEDLSHELFDAMERIGAESTFFEAPADLTPEQQEADDDRFFAMLDGRLERIGSELEEQDER